jgi:hypothetical protein
MIEKSLKTTKGKLLVKIPTYMSEVTLGQVIAIQKKQYLNDLDAISILSGIPMDELHRVTNVEDFQVFGESVLSLSYQIKYLYNSNAIPRRVTFTLDGQKVGVNVMRNLSIEPAGAFIAVSDIIADEINYAINHYGDDNWKERFSPSLNACCRVLAHYFFCRATGKPYNEREAEAFCAEIKKIKATQALPIANYFFLNYPDLLNQKLGIVTRFYHFWKRQQVAARLKNWNRIV